jgi:hypothetical protein
MIKRFSLFFIFLFLTIFTLHAQSKSNLDSKRDTSIPLNLNSKDSIISGENKVTLSGKTKYTDYKIISHQKDTTYIDTTLTLQKEYTFNFLRKDHFELLPFHNQGQTFNNLAYSFKKIGQFPDIGYRAKQFSSYEIEDINYYEVPTPTTQIMYRTGLQQGQVLETLFTTNLHKRFNFSFAYKGIRSLGQYRQSLVSQGNFRTTFSYQTKEGQYSIRSHYVSQDLLSQESGGLTPEMLDNFIREDPNFSDRARMDVNLNDTENNFNVSRFYLEHDFKLIANKDSITQKDFSNLKIGHVFWTETKNYDFNQAAVTESVFGNTSATGAIKDEVEHQITNNQLFLEFNSKYVLGTFKAISNYTSYRYGYKDILNGNSGITKTYLRGNAASFGAEWNAKLGSFKLNSAASVTPGNGRLSGNEFKAEAIYKKDSLFTLKGRLLINSRSPNFNFIFHQSTYDNYNWEHNFSNINTRNLSFSFDSKWINTSLNVTNIDNYTYFDQESTPQQFANQVTYLKLKVNRELSYKKFALDNTLMYQNVNSGSSVFRVPELTTRNTLYYTDYWFKGKPMKVQIGTTLKYFSSYLANAYNPLLGEFNIQNDTEIGFYTLDVFFNAQVRRTRLFFKIDNITSGFSKKNYFSAPNYPYRDFVIRFGLVWNWFI